MSDRIRVRTSALRASAFDVSPMAAITPARSCNCCSAIALSSFSNGERDSWAFAAGITQAHTPMVSRELTILFMGPPHLGERKRPHVTRRPPAPTERGASRSATRDWRLAVSGHRDPGSWVANRLLVDAHRRRRRQGQDLRGLQQVRILNVEQLESAEGQCMLTKHHGVGM